MNESYSPRWYELIVPILGVNLYDRRMPKIKQTTDIAGTLGAIHAWELVGLGYGLAAIVMAFSK